MNIYRFYEKFYEDFSIRRHYLEGSSARYERRQCTTCCPGSDYPKRVNKHNRDVKLYKGSFVSNILWDRGPIHVTEKLKNAFQKEGFEELVFEPTKIVADKRPSKDRKKLPLDRIPEFYWVKCRTFIQPHEDFIEQYNIKYCSECGRKIVPYKRPPLILNRKHNPGTDFFALEQPGHGRLCTEKGKAFLESYPKTYCDFELVELR